MQTSLFSKQTTLTGRETETPIYTPEEMLSGRKKQEVEFCRVCGKELKTKAEKKLGLCLECIQKQAVFSKGAGIIEHQVSLYG